MQALSSPSRSSSMVKRSSSASLIVSPAAELTLTRTASFMTRNHRTNAHPALGVAQFYQTPFEAAYSDLAKQRNLRKLKALFVEADSDNSGFMSLEEFRQALRKPWIQRTFSALGVQPHQSELVFRSMVKDKDELSIQAFIEGLTTLVGTSIDGTGRELDIDILKPTREAKLRRQQIPVPRAMHDLEAVPSQATTAVAGLGLGPVHLLPEVTIQRAFVHSATAKALFPPHTVKQQARSDSADD
eukprot:CAMPEP_0179186428 /NCGR_PEP_ID=MMETSP0796-20121207/92465_1 /TAXON_ID=73915 /ORGANISM="Pyrodinium bahamense, Strain pbaha01" /LENGTH=242 /DNA_ID=CAMNT_0020890419 /DNA_START=54 /DNA_END=782 /DNA_ORIENTATION=-